MLASATQKNIISTTRMSKQEKKRTTTTATKKKNTWMMTMMSIWGVKIAWSMTVILAEKGRCSREEGQ